MCYAESKDGIHWTKPELGLVEFRGSRKNNICLIEGEPFSLTRVNDFLSVLHEPEDPDPARRFKVAYIAHVPVTEIPGGMSKLGTKERLICSTICATSADGLTWKVDGDRPANAGGERFEVSALYRFGDFYYTTGQLLSPWSWLADGSKAGRVMLAYRSPDFKTWSQAKAFAFARPGQLANPPVKGQQTHMGAGMWNRGNVLVGLYGMWQDAAEPPAKGESFNKGVHVDLGLIVSNDGIHFREPVPGFKVIERGPEGAWDDTALLQGHAFVNEGDRTMIWYSHWDTGGKMKTMEIGLATLRRDGFGYLSAMKEDNDAHFVTAPLTAGEGRQAVDQCRWHHARGAAHGGTARRAGPAAGGLFRGGRGEGLGERNPAGDRVAGDRDGVGAGGATDRDPGEAAGKQQGAGVCDISRGLAWKGRPERS